MKKIIALFLAIIFLASCSTSNNVASNKLIQKRKYKKGWHVNSTQKIEKTANSEEVAYTDEVESKEESEPESTVAEDQTTETTNTEDNPESDLAQEIFDDQNNVVESNYEAQNSNSDEVSLVNNEVSVQEISNKPLINTSVKNEVVNQSQSSDSDIALILLVILAFILPPLAVFLVRGVGTEFWISLILFLVAIGGFAFIGGVAGLAAILGLVYALLIIFDVI